jgi:putative tricarboxylic transport membrane protein
MNIIFLLIDGFQNAFLFENIIGGLLGVIGGTILGIIPGLGPALGTSLLLPITYGMSPSVAFITLIGMYVGGQYGGSISAILLNIPGTSANVATAFDGYPLTKKGQSGLAIGIATLFSVLGGIFGSIVLVFTAPQLAKFALKFGPPEYFVLAMFGLSVVVTLAGKSILKGLLSCFIGLFVAAIGLDPVSGVGRYMFGMVAIGDGISLVPLMIGLFAVSEAFVFVNQTETVSRIRSKIQGSLIPTLKDIRKSFTNFLRGSIIGTFIGILPGAGGTIAGFVAYGEAVRNSKEPEKFGKGAIEGIAATESANNAACGGALIPMLALGIPGSSITAIILGGFILHGIRPGPLLFTQHTKLLYTVLAGTILVNIIMYPVGLLGAKIFSKVLDVPKSILSPTILLFSVIGSYSIRNSILDIWIMLIFGLLGFIMCKFKIPTAPLILGVVLGEMAETSLRRGLLITGDFISFFTRPIVIILTILTILSFLSPYIRSRIKKK